MDLDTVIKMFLRTRPMHGYEMGKHISKTLAYSKVNVYVRLKKLYKEGKIDYVRIQAKDTAPHRMEYRLLDDDVGDYGVEPTSFRRTKAAYCLLLDDIQAGTTLHGDYVAHMEQSEQAFLRQHGYSIEAQNKTPKKKATDNKTARNNGQKKIEEWEKNIAKCKQKYGSLTIG